MSFLFKRPFIFFFIGGIILFASLALLLSRGSPESETNKIIFSNTSPPTLGSDTIAVNKNTTLSVTIENLGPTAQVAELRITTTNLMLSFFYSINRSLLSEPTQLGSNYTISYSNRYMNPGEAWSISLVVKGTLLPGDQSFRYAFYLEIYADEVLSDVKTVYLNVTR